MTKKINQVINQEKHEKIENNTDNKVINSGLFNSTFVSVGQKIVQYCIVY